MPCKYGCVFKRNIGRPPRSSESRSVRQIEQSELARARVFCYWSTHVNRWCICGPCLGIQPAEPLHCNPLGRYEKFTSNAGYISKDSDLAQAFTHFTWEFTAGDIMVADIQGGGNTLTDPQIHSQDTDRFGRGNLATKGMDAFFLNHTCNDICHTLKLREHPLQPGPAPEDVVAWPGLNAIPEMATSGRDHEPTAPMRRTMCCSCLR